MPSCQASRKNGWLGKVGGASGKDSGVMGKAYGTKGGRPKLENSSRSHIYGYPEDKYKELLEYFSTWKIPIRFTTKYLLANYQNLEQLSKEEVAKTKKRIKNSAAD